MSSVESTTPVATPVVSSTDATNSSNSDKSTPVADGRKLYVGNVEYKTTKSDIYDLFKDYDVKSVEIPTKKSGQKGFRTRGYVFVNFGENDNLDAIIEKFTDFEFKGRQIYLRYPKVRSESEDNKAEEPKSSETESSSSSSTKTPKTKSKSKPKPKAKKTKQPKEKIPFEQGERSTDTLHLKNLSFSVKSKDLKEFFEAEGETPQWASVPFITLPGYILKKLEAQGKSLERRNKGYAFVKLTLKDGETIDDKVAKFNGKTLGDRELIVSVAIDVRKAAQEKEEEKKAENEKTAGQEQPAESE